MSSNFISVDGLRLHYASALPTNRNENVRGTFLLIHGFLSNCFTWRKVLQPLADRTQCRIIAYDRLAFGLTERTLDKEKFTRKYEEIFAFEFLRQLNIFERVHLISNSSGAVIAFDLAVARPDLIQSIIFVAPYGLLRVQHPSGPIARYLIGTRPMQWIFKRILMHFLPFKNAYYNVELVRDETIRQDYLKPLIDDPLFIPSLVLFTQNYDVSSSPISLEEIRSNPKILIICGEEDRIVRRRETEEFYTKLRKIRGERNVTEIKTIGHCGHLPQEEQAEPFVDLICEFFERNYSKP